MSVRTILSSVVLVLLIATSALAEIGFDDSSPLRIVSGRPWEIEEPVVQILENSFPVKRKEIVMEKIKKKDKRNGCLPNLGRINPWNGKREKKADDTVKTDECCSSQPRKEVTEGKPHQEVVAEMVRDYKEEEDSEIIKDNSLVHVPSDANKNNSLRDQEVMGFVESLDTQKHIKSDEELKVEQGSESVDVNKQDLPKFGAWESIQSSEDVEDIFKPCRSEVRRRGDMTDDFSKVKTFDLRGVSKSSDKGEGTIINRFV